MSYILNFDNTILNLIQTTMHNPFLDTCMPFITSLGDKGFLWLVIAFFLICIPKQRRFGIILLCTLIATALIGEVFLKNIIERVRPCNVVEMSAVLIPPPASFSFPSGHTASSFASALILWKWNKRFGIFAYFCAFLIAFSRLYLFVHYPTDILGGILLGTCVSLFIYHFSKKYLH